MQCQHIISGIAHKASGPSYSVPRLCEALCGEFDIVNLFTSEARPDASRFTFSVKWFPLSFPWSRRVGLSRKLGRELVRACDSETVVHNHGLWSAVNQYAVRAKAHSRCLLVVSPRGTLSVAARRISPIKKFIAWNLGHKKVCAWADGFHATSVEEAQDIRALGFCQPIAVIPNGVDIPGGLPDASRANRRRLLFLGRIHPIKGLDRLIKAWEIVHHRFPDWDLHIVGPGLDSHRQALSDQLLRSTADRIFFRGEVVGENRSAEFWNSELFILPSYSENFGMTVIEAAAHGLPVIASLETPWSRIEKVGAGWWCDAAFDKLADTLSVALAMDRGKLRSMGLRARALADSEFNWSGIGRQMAEYYRWLSAGGDCPSFVMCD